MASVTEGAGRNDDVNEEKWTSLRGQAAPRLLLNRSGERDYANARPYSLYFLTKRILGANSKAFPHARDLRPRLVGRLSAEQLAEH